MSEELGTLWVKWEDDTRESVDPTKWEMRVAVWHNNIPESLRSGEVRPVWKYVKRLFEIIFHKPNHMAILAYEITQAMRADITKEIDKEIIVDLLKLTEKGNKND